jgi:hypothetical protein
VLAVIRIDDRLVGRGERAGKIGPVFQAVRKAYDDAIAACEAGH